MKYEDFIIKHKSIIDIINEKDPDFIIDLKEIIYPIIQTNETYELSLLIYKMFRYMILYQNNKDKHKTSSWIVNILNTELDIESYKDYYHNISESKLKDIYNTIIDFTHSKNEMNQYYSIDYISNKDKVYEFLIKYAADESEINKIKKYKELENE